jgi:hypothetical protein
VRLELRVQLELMVPKEYKGSKEKLVNKEYKERPEPRALQVTKEYKV